MFLSNPSSFTLLPNQKDNPEIPSSKSDIPLIPLPRIPSKILLPILKHCKALTEYRAKSLTSSEFYKFEEKFFNVERNMLFHFIVASEFLQADELMDSACKVLAEMVRGKTTEELREEFGVKNDFRPEELKQVAVDNGWGDLMR